MCCCKFVNFHCEKYGFNTYVTGNLMAAQLMSAEALSLVDTASIVIALILPALPLVHIHNFIGLYMEL
jgi:hypothetical protein